MKAVLGNLAYDVANDDFSLPAAGSLATIYSNVLAQLSTVPATALTQWTTNWGPMLKEFSDTLLRANGIEVKVDFAIAQLVKAMTLTTTPLTLTDLVNGMSYQNVIIGTAANDNRMPLKRCA